MPTYAANLMFSWSADLIAIVALLATGRFALALAGMDVGTAFGGIGSSREMMIASLAEPAMLLVVFSVALIAGTTQLSTIADDCSSTPASGLRVSLGLGLFAFVFVAIAENARIPIDNPATHLELTMVHEAMVLEYSGRHLAMIEAAAAVKLVLYFSLLACLFLPFGMATTDKGLGALAIGIATYLAKIFVLAVLLADRRDRGRQDAGVPLSDFPRRRVRGGCARRVPAVRVAGLLMTQSLGFDIAHLLAGGMLVLSFVLLYQDRITAVLNVFALQAIVLSLSVAWQSLISECAASAGDGGDRVRGQRHHHPRRAAPDRAPARHPSRDRGGHRRRADHADGARPGRAVDPAGHAGRANVSVLVREDLAFALAVILLGLLMMITRRNAVTQIVGFMSLENGLVLAATGAKGMPLVVEFSVAFSILIAFIVFGVFVFRIRERFDTVDVSALDQFRGERGERV